MKRILFLLWLPLLWHCAAQPEGRQLTLNSPKGLLQLHLHLQQGKLHLHLSAQTDTLFEVLPAGFELHQQAALDSFEWLSTDIDTLRQDWQMVWGEKKQVHNNYVQAVLHLRDRRAQRLIDLHLRLFDDGLGFRYHMPQQPGLDSLVLLRELTQYRFPTQNTVWWSPWDRDSYEKLFRTTPLAQVDSAGTPLTMQTPTGHYLALHEAALVDFAEMFLVRTQANTLQASLSPLPDGIAARVATPFDTPWRTVVVSATAGGLIESDLVLNLNEPSRIDDTSWIRPMTYIGMWWALHLGIHTWFEGDRHGASTANALRYIDFAAQNNIGGVLFEGWNTGWDKWGQANAFDQLTPAADFDLARVAAYAQEKGVALIGHHETGGDIPYYEQHLERAFALCDSLGIRAVKTGYAGAILPKGYSHSDQRAVRHYHHVVQTAARHRVALNVHEPIKPTGLRRTYPNLMTGEGVRGTEYNAWSAGNPPSHMLTIPFTRMLAGPLDYTPGIFDLKMQRFAQKRVKWVAPEQMHYQVQSTLAQQLALSVILYSPLQMAADLIENYQGHPAFEFYRHLKTSFDESRVPQAAIGQYLTIVRRAGNEWFVGSATNEQARRVDLRLDFLQPGRTYRAQLYLDGPKAHYLQNPTDYRIEQQVVNNTTVLQLDLAPGGGAAIYLVEQ